VRCSHYEASNYTVYAYVYLHTAEPSYDVKKGPIFYVDVNESLYNRGVYAIVSSEELIDTIDCPTVGKVSFKHMS
jgi:hypothetical protein